MGLIIGLIKRLIRLLIYITIFAAIIVFIPNLPPYTSFTSIKLAPTQQKVGPLATNGALNNAGKLYTDKLLGPEAFQLYNGEVYTSLATGEIVKISPGGHVTFVTKIGRPCVGIVHEHVCGRPLGFQIDEKTNTLYVVDAYHGIWKVDLKTDKKQVLVSPQVPIDGRNPKLLNGIALAKNGDFYWTDSTSDFHLKDGAISILADPSGRLFYYNAAKNQSKVLLADLWFANSVIISPDQKFVLVSETSRYRVVKYYIDGPKKGASEVFVDGLPGAPDNIRALPDGSGVLVALYISFDDEHPLLAKSMSETPLVRKFLARLQRLIEIPFEYLNNLYPHIILQEITYFIGHFRSLSGLAPAISGLVQLDWNGNIVASYYNTDGSLGHISDAIVYNGNLYTGSPHVQNFIGSVPAPPLLLTAFSKAKEAPKGAETQQQAKPIPKQEKVVKREAPKPVESVPTKPAEKAKPTAPVVESQQKPAAPPAKPPTPPPTKQPEQKPAPAVKEPSKPTPPQRQQAETKPTAKPDVKATAQSEAKPTQKPDIKPTPKPEIKTTPKPETKPTPKPETKATPKVETKPTPKPEMKPTQKPETKVNSKPEVQTTPMPKTADSKPSTVKPSEAKQTKPQEPEKKKSETRKPQQNNKKEGVKPTPQEIPITEEIPSDTSKPSKETLKVIKKSGPAEIPNPNLV